MQILRIAAGAGPVIQHITAHLLDGLFILSNQEGALTKIVALDGTLARLVRFTCARRADHHPDGGNLTKRLLAVLGRALILLRWRRRDIG